MIDCRTVRRVKVTWQFGLGVLLAFVIVAANPLATVAQGPAIASAAMQPDKTDLDDRDDDANDADFEELGLTSPNSYESPQFGYEVEWDDPWFADLVEYPEGTLVSDPDTSPPFDMLRVQSDDTDESVYVYGYQIEDSWLEDVDDIPEAHIDRFYDFEAGEGLDDTPWESIQILHDDADDEFGSVLYLVTWDTGDQYITMSELRVVDDFYIITALSTDPLLFVETLESAQDEIDIDGNRALSFLDLDDVADAVEAAIAEHDLDGSVNDPEETPDNDDRLMYYLQGVRGAANALNDYVDRFFELLSSDEDLTDEDVDELNGILAVWASAPTLAIAGNPPAGVDDIHDILLDYLDTLAEAADAFVVYAQSDDEDEQEEYGELFDELIEDAYALFDELIDALDAAE